MIHLTKNFDGPVRKDRVALINGEADIPEVLKEVVHVVNGKIFFDDCKEGAEMGLVPCFIAWEANSKMPRGINVWIKSDGFDVLFQEDGVWYQRPKVVKAATIDWDNIQIPDFATTAPIDIEEGRLVLHASWGDQSCKAPEPYYILGYSNGTFALLGLETESAREYYLCTEDGKVLKKLVD